MKKMLIALAVLGCLTGTAPAQLGQEPNQPLQSQDLGPTAQPYHPIPSENQDTESSAAPVFFIIGALTVTGVLAAYALNSAPSRAPHPA